jgi:hypothetical protein
MHRSFAALRMTWLREGTRMIELTGKHTPVRTGVEGVGVPSTALRAGRGGWVHELKV